MDMRPQTDRCDGTLDTEPHANYCYCDFKYCRNEVGVCEPMATTTAKPTTTPICGEGETFYANNECFERCDSPKVVCLLEFESSFFCVPDHMSLQAEWRVCQTEDP